MFKKQLSLLRWNQPSETKCILKIENTQKISWKTIESIFKTTVNKLQNLNSAIDVSLNLFTPPNLLYNKYNI